jgi:predicted carbohydrate-binding protein with CBM5 and CBM33 domain
MSVRRTAAAAAAVGFAAAIGVWPAFPAQAHGAPISPLNRASACAVASPLESTPACVAALAANARPFGGFDNLRVPGVAGNDKQFIPDGQLCSASLPEFRGLDLARTDWPTTKLESGSVLSMQYLATIPHRGSFRLYLTRAGWDPAQPLRWADLGDPILTVADPPLVDGSYRISGRLPAGRVGAHLLYTVWQTSDTPDTYYSCSDLTLTPARGAAAGGPVPPKAPSGPAAGAGQGRPNTPRVETTIEASAPAASARPPVVDAAPPEASSALGRESWLGPAQPVLGDRIALGQQLVSAALVVIVGVTAGLGFMRMRAARAAQGLHRKPQKR